MIERERLSKIFNLNIAGKIDFADEGQLNAYAQILNSFVGSFPAAEKKIKADLAAADYESCRKSLADVCDMLKRIHADFLVEECIRQTDGLGKNEHEKSVAHITNFLAAISSLSVDVQMAIYKPEQGPKTPDEPETDRNSVLAVDDVAFFLSRLKLFLKDTPCKLTCVTSGEAALRFIRSHRPALFLLDIEMPEMDGYALARAIRASGHTAPIMFLTGNDTKSCVIKAVEAGASDFIIKPINKEQLIEKIGKFIKL